MRRWRIGLILPALMLGARVSGAQADGSIVAWGDLSLDNLPVPNRGFVAVSAGGGHGLALKAHTGDGSYPSFGDINPFVALLSGTQGQIGERVGRPLPAQTLLALPLEFGPIGG